MYKVLFSILLVSFGAPAWAKQVRFAVDMTGQTVSANGVHVTGDFQAIAGYAGGDWVSNTTTLTQEGSSNIYSIVIDLPAFAKYEYKFVNGDQFYDAEFVPVESRVGYDFNDNRWIYVDSTDNSVFSTGAILFAGNAPAGKTLVRFLVNMQNETVSASGVHVAGSFQGNNPASTVLYSFGNDIYEVICYADAGTLTYKFYNGNSASVAESVPSSCATGGNRQVNLAADQVLATVCFASCSNCLTAGLENKTLNTAVSLCPNPTQHTSVLTVEGVSGATVKILDVKGSVISLLRGGDNQFILERGNLGEGIYFVQVLSGDQLVSTVKWVVR